MARNGGTYPISASDPDVVFHRPVNRLGFKLNPSPRELGIELETNNYTYLSRGKQMAAVADKWSIAVKDDGSIGPFPTGMEFNLSPASGDKVIDQVNEVCAALAVMGTKPTQKCGIHVHVNAADLRADDLKKVIDIYVRVERALFDLCHPLRLNGTYSQVCGKKYAGIGKTGADIRRNLVKEFFNNDAELQTTKKLNKSYYPTPQSRHHAIKEMGDSLVRRKESGRVGGIRYRALNLVSYYKRRTIEFRHYESTINAPDVYNWAMVVGEVINAASRMSAVQISVLPRNSRKALFAVIPERLHGWVIDKWSRMDKLNNETDSWKSNRARIWGI